MATNRRLTSLAVLFVFFALSSNLFSHPTEPQATFQVKNGWVEVAMRQDGKPLTSATFEIMDEKGVKFGDGEIDADGQTAFPLPQGASFVVEIKTGDRTADPIRLFKTDAGVEPARVLLSYGLRPCCRSIKVRGDAPTGADESTTQAPLEKPTPWLFLVSLVVLVLAVSSILVVTLFHRYGNGIAFVSRK